MVKRNLLVHRTQIGINSMLSLWLFFMVVSWVGWVGVNVKFWEICCEVENNVYFCNLFFKLITN